MLPCLSAATQHTLLFISPQLVCAATWALQSYSENQVAARSCRLPFCMQTTSCTHSRGSVFFSFHSALWKVYARFSVCYCQCLPSLFIIIISVENIFLGRVFADPYPSFTAPEYTHLIKDSVVKSTAWELIFKLCLWLHGWPWVGWLDHRVSWSSHLNLVGAAGGYVAAEEDFIFLPVSSVSSLRSTREKQAPGVTFLSQQNLLRQHQNRWVKCFSHLWASKHTKRPSSYLIWSREIAELISCVLTQVSHATSISQNKTNFRVVCKVDSPPVGYLNLQYQYD